MSKMIDCGKFKTFPIGVTVVDLLSRDESPDVSHLEDEARQWFAANNCDIENMSRFLDARERTILWRCTDNQ